jgi:hypothetical protein
MITGNFKEVNAFIRSVPKQVNYGAMIGINKLAEHIRDSELQSAKSVFNLRGRWYEPRSRFGFNIVPAKKSNLVAEVFTRADWLYLHTSGGVKKARGGDIALPSQYIKRNKKDIITSSNRPRNIQGAFKHTFKSGNAKGKTAIVKAYRAGDERRIVILYWLERSANIKKEYDFYMIGRKVFDRNSNKYLNDGISIALKTAKGVVR